VLLSNLSNGSRRAAACITAPGVQNDTGPPLQYDSLLQFLSQ